MLLRGATGDEAIFFSDKDCFAEFILSPSTSLRINCVEGLATTISHIQVDPVLANLALKWWKVVGRKAGERDPQPDNTKKEGRYESYLQRD